MAQCDPATGTLGGNSGAWYRLRDMALGPGRLGFVRALPYRDRWLTSAQWLAQVGRYPSRRVNAYLPPVDKPVSMGRSTYRAVGRQAAVWTCSSDPISPTAGLESCPSRGFAIGRLGGIG
jgi:hypothetical protein